MKLNSFNFLNTTRHPQCSHKCAMQTGASLRNPYIFVLHLVNRELCQVLIDKFMTNIIDSPESISQVSFSDHNLSVVRRRCSSHKLFIFPSSSTEPLGQFQPHLTQSILEWWWFMFVQMKGHIPFPRGDNNKIAKRDSWNLKISSPEPLSQF